nr:hypothetical protein [Angustibacter aerolatus]
MTEAGRVLVVVPTYDERENLEPGDRPVARREPRRRRAGRRRRLARRHR